MKSRTPDMDKIPAEDKFSALLDALKRLDSLVVAFSGGVDSTLLLAAGKAALGKDRVLAATAASSIRSSGETVYAAEMAGRLGMPQRVFDPREMDLKAFRVNDRDRCYHCKRLLFKRIREIAEEAGLAHVAHGANRDDLSDFRPGFRAAEEEGILSPLMTAGFGKAEIRALAGRMGLPNWRRPAMACLATRIPYGEPLTERGLRQVEQAEAYLDDRGFSGIRVRSSVGVARIEAAPEDLHRFLDPGLRAGLVEHFRSLGFTHISIDLEGYLPGKVNRPVD